MTFNAHADKWFDRLSAYARRHDEGNSANPINVLRVLAGKRATRRNATALVTTVRDIADPNLQAHVQAVLNRQFRPEFRYAFSRTGAQVSAASELFSLIRQAVARTN